MHPCSADSGAAPGRNRTMPYPVGLNKPREKSNMSMNRRQVLRSTLAFAVSASVIPHVVIAGESPAVTALDKSQLIYLSPVVSGGRESACKGEVWFIHHENQIYVVTQADAWRAEAVRKGFTRAKIWIGEFGMWKSAGDRYRSAPYLEIEGQIESDREKHLQLLPVFGKKYAAEWGSWGPRFRDGLSDGSRVMLRYTVAS